MARRATRRPAGVLSGAQVDHGSGPESWSDNWNVSVADLNGDGVLDYRMPPVWEYGNASAGLYRAFSNLSRDLGRIVRFVAINLLFTSSPLYDPMISAPKVPSTINIDMNVYQAEPGVDGRSFLRGGMVSDKLGALQSTNAFSSEVNSEPFTSRADSVYRCWLLDVSCFGNRLFGVAFGDLFLFHNDHLNRFIDGDADYEVPVFLYNTTDALSAPLLGFADDNWRDGTQSYVFGFDSTSVRNVLGYGLTTTTIHEVGHHIAMSHPHDGYDSTLDADYGASGPTYYANSGDESNSIMSYIDLNWDFSQFDRDNMARYLTAGYINQANGILARIYASPRAADGSTALLQADARAAQALSAFASREWGTAATHAKAAYLAVLAAAELANVHIEPQNYTADYRAKGRSPHYVDTLDGHRGAP